MAARDVLMPIGRFARSCRLSIKALRHYDDQGILKPALVDVSSGYRYYARRQARDAVAVSLLRSLGVTLPVVGEILAGSPERQQALLASEARRLEDEPRERGEALRTIQRLLREGALLPYTIAVRREPPITVAECAVSTTPDQLWGDTVRLVGDVLAAVRAAGRPALPPIMSLMEEPGEGERFALRVCARIDPPCDSIAGAEVVDLPGGSFASLVHRGPYEELHVAYHALHAWLLEHGHEPAGPLREIYRNDPDVVTKEDLETEVLLPITE